MDSTRLFTLASGDDDNNNNQDSNQLSRRRFTILSSLGLLGASFANIYERTPSDYPFYNLLPVGPYKRKKTIFKEIVPGQVWTADQKFGILNVQVPLRMTIIKLSGGGLFIYDPIAPTQELVDYVKSLEQIHGPVKHIVLGSVAIEHKVYASVFSQKFGRNAQVWIQPGQYAFPLNLPSTFLGFPPKAKLIPNRNDVAAIPDEWKRDFEFDTLGPIISKDGAFGETVFYHKSTKTLLCTDTVLEVTEEVPEIYNDDPKPLLYHARDTVTDVVQDSPEVRKRGWRRIALFGLFFTPAALNIKDSETAFKERRPDINPDFAGIYPWDWVGDDVSSFKALQGGLLVAPILQKLILNRNPIEVLDFANRVSKWDIARIIPAHFKNNLQYDGKSYRQAFSFLEASGVPPGLPKPLEADFQTLNDAEVNLQETGAIAKAPPLPGGSLSRADILAQTAYGCRGGICTPRAPVDPTQA